jgi:hypothetical protein
MPQPTTDTDPTVKFPNHYVRTNPDGTVTALPRIDTRNLEYVWNVRTTRVDRGLQCVVELTAHKPDYCMFRVTGSAVSTESFGEAFRLAQDDALAVLADVLDPGVTDERI